MKAPRCMPAFLMQQAASPPAARCRRSAPHGTCQQTFLAFPVVAIIPLEFRSASDGGRRHVDSVRGAHGRRARSSGCPTLWEATEDATHGCKGAQRPAAALQAGRQRRRRRPRRQAESAPLHVAASAYLSHAPRRAISSPQSTRPVRPQRRTLPSRCQAAPAALPSESLKARIAANFDQLFVTLEGKQYISVEKVCCMGVAWLGGAGWSKPCAAAVLRTVPCTT